MPDLTPDTLDVKELVQFREDQAAVERALSRAAELASTDAFTDRQEAGRAADVVKELRQIRTAAEARRKSITADWRAMTSAVGVQYKELLSPLEAAEEALKHKTLAFNKAEQARAEEAHRQEEARQQAELEAKIAEAQEAAELAAEDPEMQELADEARREAAAASVVPPAPQHDAPKQVRGSFGAVGSRTTWRVEIVDFAALPDIYKIANEQALRQAAQAEAAAAKAQQRPFALDVPGVRFWADETAVSR